MADVKLCTLEAEDTDESEYSYEYVTDSEYEDDEEDEDNQIKESVEVSDSVKLPEQPVDDVDRGVEAPTRKEDIEAMKPKLPAYITTPEPCAFSEDPCKWIAWMEDEVNKERDRRMNKIISSSPEVPHLVEDEDSEKDLIEEPDAEVGISQNEQEDNHSDVPMDNNEAIDEKTTVPMDINEESDNDQEKMEESEQSSIEIMEAPDNQEEEGQDQKETENVDDESEWEYTSDDDDDDNEGPCDEVKQDENESIHPAKELQDVCNGKEIEINHLSSQNECEIVSQHDADASQSQSRTSEQNVKKSFEKQISCPANTSSSLVPPDIQKKLDFIRKKKASVGQTAGENPDTQTKNTNSVLDEETQKKLAFIRQKKQENALNTEVLEEKDESIGTNLLRQLSNPETNGRPQSMAADASLDDMLTRIKALREERKQILQDMSAIKTAFGGQVTSSGKSDMNDQKSEQESGAVDDGIGSGVHTPNSEMLGSFHNDVDSVAGDSNVMPVASLSRQARGSFDSGIGSKSLCSNQDGSPTAELETRVPKSGNLDAGTGTKKINRDKSVQEGDISCFICGENMGKLSKGAIMHMGLEDGDPVCADALYLTDDSKDKIRQIACTKTFSFQAKYDLLETLELETWDIDYDIPAGDIMDKVDAFLVDVEVQKQRDKEKFDAMRTGAIDEIFNEEFADLIKNRVAVKPESLDNCDQMDIGDSDSSEKSENTTSVPSGNKPSSSHPSPPPLPPPMPVSLQPPPPPPVPPSAHSPSKPVSIPTPPPALSAVLEAIKQGSPNLRHTETVDKSEISVGKVIHRHIAPIAFNRDIRSVVKDIAKDDHKKRLKKVKTNDKSRPYIPNDVEIYFYGGPTSASKSAPPPPLSKLKFSNPSTKRANVRMDNGVSPVYLAAQEGHLEVLQYLVEEGGDINARAQDGMAPIHAAAQMGYLSCIEWMVKDKGVNINLKDGDDATPLHFAASRGHTQTVRWLLSEGAKILPDKFGKTPLNDATENNQSDALVALLKHTRAEEKCDCSSQNESKTEPFYLHTPPSQKKEDPEDSEAHEYEAISEDDQDGERRDFFDATHAPPRVGVPPPPRIGAPPPPPLPPPDLLTPALNRRTHIRRNSGDSINSLSTLSSKEDEEGHVLKPSELSKGKKRKNIPREENSQDEEPDRPIKPGAHMVLPFIPPKFSGSKREGDSLIKPSEFLRSLMKNSSDDVSPAGQGSSEDAHLASEESGFESPDSSLPSVSSSPYHNSPHTLPVIPESAAAPSSATATAGVPPPPPPPPAAAVGGPPPPPPPPPPHPTLTSTVSAPPSLQAGKEERGNPASLAISMRELQSVQLKKTDRPSLDRTHSVPLPRLLPNKSQDFGDTKGDLIAELKLSHNVGGVSKLKSEQAKAQEELEKEQYKKFLAQFTTENFLKKIPGTDPLGSEIPKWKREMMAKKAAEKAKSEALEERARLEEARRLSSIPAWKRQLMDKKGDEAKRAAKQKKEREKERKKKLICRL